MLMASRGYRRVRQNIDWAWIRFEFLEQRCLLSGSGAGVTVITHGFQTSVGIPDWEISMAQAILDRADGPLTGRNVGSLFTHDPMTGRWNAVPTSIWDNSNAASDHVVLLYDWSAESNFFENGWLDAAADHLFASLLQSNDNLSGDFNDTSFRDLACNDPLACTELNVHFIGHSRGAVLNSQVTSRFAEHFPETTIQQVTALDPHPAAPMNDVGYVSSNPNANSRLFTYENVGFADSYFRQDGLYELDGDFNGVVTDGGFNLQIPESVLTGSGSFFEHLDVHTWYYGTITEPFAANYSGYSGAGRNHDGDTSFPETWYGVSGVPARDNAGFAFSQIGGADQQQLPPEYVFQGNVSPPRVSASVFNGDFGLGSVGSLDIPGWTYHASGGTAKIAGGPRYLQIQPADDFRLHNPLFFADRVSAVQFDYWVNAAGPDDVLQVLIDDAVVDSIPLDVATADFQIGYASALGFSHHGFVGSLEFRLMDNLGGSKSAQVRLDNISLLEVAVPEGDFDSDGDLDCADVDQLTTAIAMGSANLTYDLNGDQRVDLQDLDRWLMLGGAMNLASGNPYLRGDADLDGRVDGADFLVWNQFKFTQNSNWCSGDFNADGFVDGQDFVLWNQNKFQMSDQSVRSPWGLDWPRAAEARKASGELSQAAIRDIEGHVPDPAPPRPPVVPAQPRWVQAYRHREVPGAQRSQGSWSWVYATRLASEGEN